MTSGTCVEEPNWKPFLTVPKKRARLWFKWADGTVEQGDLEPYWCGSDCPCYCLDDGPSEPLTSYPECWGVKGNDTDPVYWAPVESVQ